MSWFDTSNIVSLAKSTLKEAQKTIDKALDITDDESVNDDVKKISGKDTVGGKVESEPSTPLASSSIWGSFTGSFFDATSPDSGFTTNTSSISKQPDNTSSLQESFSLIKQRSLGGSGGTKGKQSRNQLLNQSLDQTFKRKLEQEDTLNEGESIEDLSTVDKEEFKKAKDKRENSLNVKNNQEKEGMKVKTLEVKDSFCEGDAKNEKSDFGIELQPQGDGACKNEEKKNNKAKNNLSDKDNINKILKLKDSKTEKIDDSIENVCDKSVYSQTVEDNCYDKKDSESITEYAIRMKNLKETNPSEIRVLHKEEKNSNTNIKPYAAQNTNPDNPGLKSVEQENQTLKKEEFTSQAPEPDSQSNEKKSTTVEVKENVTGKDESSIGKSEKTNDKADSKGDKFSTESSISPPSEIILRRKKIPSESEVKRRSDRFSTGSSGGNNRLSTVSADSCRLSSESTSVEIITSPDSNGASRSMSNSTMTSPSVEIISESKSRSSDSVEVLKSDEDSKEEIEEEAEDFCEMDDSMSESTQTLTTAVNVMLKSSSSLETSFSEMNSSRENISLSRTLHLPLSKSSTLSQSQTSNPSLSQSQTSNPTLSQSQTSHQTMSQSQTSHQTLIQSQSQLEASKSASQSDAPFSSHMKTVSFTGTGLEENFQEEQDSENTPDVINTQPCSRNKTKPHADTQSKSVTFSESNTEEKESSEEGLSDVYKDSTQNSSRSQNKNDDLNETKKSTSGQVDIQDEDFKSCQNNVPSSTQTRPSASSQSGEYLSPLLSAHGIDSAFNERTLTEIKDNTGSTVNSNNRFVNEVKDGNERTLTEIKDNTGTTVNSYNRPVVEVIKDENERTLTEVKDNTGTTVNSHNRPVEVEKDGNESVNESLLSENSSSITRDNQSVPEDISQVLSEAQASVDNQKVDSNMEASSSTLVSSSIMNSSSSMSSSGNTMNSSANTINTSSSTVDTSGNSTLVGSSDDGTFVHVPRDSSPISLERCELIKIGSGHTSGDDMDTNTTSSSIEIISSPYGDNSSYGAPTSTSRASPSKLPCRPSAARRGGDDLSPGGRGVQTHRRAPSETSSEDTETERLQKRISEMTEVLEAREMKLLSLSKQHSDLSETHSKLKSENDNFSQMNEEFTQRLATLEKQYQQVMTEKENLRRQVEATKLAATRQGQDEDKDEIIAQLRSEGAALSRQQMLLTTSVRKLRAAEKDANRTRDSLRGELDSRTADLERLQKLVQAKEEVERSQIEAVNQLTKTNIRLERDVASLQQQLDTLTSTLIESQKELQTRTAALSELERRLETNTSSVETKLRQELEMEMNLEMERREQVERSMEHLRQSMMTSEQDYTQRIEKLRQENLASLHRLEEARLRNEQLAESMISATTPLTQQIETLTSTHAQATQAWEEEERRLNEKINELNSRLSSLKHIERSSKESSMAMSNKISALESKLESEHRDVLRLREQLQTMNEDIEKWNREKDSALQAKDVQIKSLTHELAECRRSCIGLEQRLSVERAALESEQRRLVSLQDQMQGYQQASSLAQGTYSSVQVGTDGRENAASPPAYHSYSQGSSPLSLGRPVSVSDSVFPPSEDGDNPHAHSSLNKHVYDSLRLGGTTSLIESLQSQIKLKDTEVQHLTWELSRRDLERTSLTSQLTSLASRVEELESVSRDHADTQTQYDALLQMYGEKMEECQELRLDLDDVKEMYKAQIDQLLKRDESG